MGSDRTSEILSIGHNGSTIITSTGTHVGAWRKIVVIGTTEFTTLTDSRRIGSIASVSFPANYEITGEFSTIVLASGSIIAYV